MSAHLGDCWLVVTASFFAVPRVIVLTGYAFQYIVTTTTKPLDAVRRQPWLRLELAGHPTDHRLLKCDL